MVAWLSWNMSRRTGSYVGVPMFTGNVFVPGLAAMFKADFFAMRLRMFSQIASAGIPDPFNPN